MRRQLILLLLTASASLAQDASNYLDRVASTYRALDTFKVKSVASLSNVTEERSIIAKIVHVALFFVAPFKARVDASDGDDRVQSVLISDGSNVTEYLAWRGEYTVTPGTRLSVNFSPDHGTGYGEMIYDTINRGVTKTSLAGTEKLQI